MKRTLTSQVPDKEEKIPHPQVFPSSNYLVEEKYKPRIDF